MTSPSPSPFPTPILSLDRVSKRFAGHTAVDELSLSIPQGVIYGLLGPNGAGKTTTIRMVMDILRPDGGAVRLFGEPGGGRAHAERIGYLPEERGLYRKMRVLDVLVFLGEMKGIDRRGARQRAGEWLERLGLAQWRLRRVDELSKGMQQKVQFISTVLHDPDLLVLDEPFSGLDPVNTQVMKDTVLDLRSRGKTILFLTHIMEQAEKLCEQLCIIELPPPRDDAQLLAQLFGLLHDVGREQDGLPATPQVEHGVLHDLRVHRIQSRERLVQNQEIRVVEHGRDELHLLLRALGQLIDPAQAPLTETESLEPCLGLL